MKGIQTSAIAAITILCALSASAKTDNFHWPKSAISGISLERRDANAIVAFKIAPEAFQLKANREILITPMLVAESDTLVLPPATIAGRTRYFQHRRKRDIKAPEMLIRDDAPLRYSAITDYKDWLPSASLILKASEAGCCGVPSASLPALELAITPSRKPAQVETSPELQLNAEMIYVAPKKELVKTRSLSGKAYIDFPVNQTEIYPEYRRNPEELAAIRSTFDQIRSDRDVDITSISFKGYASPEGPYANNERLARERTLALMAYVRSLYNFPDGVMKASWVAEDWDGLTLRLLDLNIPNRNAIYDIIVDPSLSYDAKDQAIKMRFPVQYEFLLREVYPALRHSDYLVEFKVKNYVDVTEIATVYEQNPSKLSNDEIFLYAQTFPRESAEYRDVIATAARLFPSDPAANFNAGVAAIAEGDFDKALEFLRKAEDLGMEQAPALIRQISDLRKAAETPQKQTSNK